MKRITVVALLVAGLMAVPAAEAKTYKCSGRTYMAIDQGAFPGIQTLRATGLPRRTDGYAPRCLVAESVAMLIQVYWDRHYRMPRRVWTRGARWNGGTWTCSYRWSRRFESPSKYAVCKRRGRRVTMYLVS